MITQNKTIFFQKPLNIKYEPYIEIQRWEAVLNIVSGVSNHFVICVAICSVYYSIQDCINIA